MDAGTAAAFAIRKEHQKVTRGAAAFAIRKEHQKVTRGLKDIRSTIRNLETELRKARQFRELLEASTAELEEHARTCGISLESPIVGFAE